MSLPYVCRNGDAQRLAWIGGSTHEVVLDGTATDGRLTAFRSAMKREAASPQHVHATDDETIFVLQGELCVWAGEQTWTLRDGDSVFLPRGVPHTYTCTADSHLLTVCNPSGMENFLRAAGWDLKDPLPEDWAVDLAALQRAAVATGQTILGPPLKPGDTMSAASSAPGGD